MYPALMRFTTTDPLAEKYYSISPYAYCGNNPIKFVDTDGKRIANPGKYVLHNRTLMEQLAKFDKAISMITGLDRNSYTFNITGGDRYKKNGGIYSATKNTIIEKSAKFSPHLRECGALGVDLAFAKGVSYENVKAAANLTGMRLDPSGRYADGHFHLDIKNYKGEFIYEPIYYIPTDEDFKEEINIIINEVVIIAKKLYSEKSLEERIQDALWTTVKSNAYGNTGKYNNPGRITDQFYSDDFLKWYYDRK